MNLKKFKITTIMNYILPITFEVISWNERLCSHQTINYDRYLLFINVISQFSGLSSVGYLKLAWHHTLHMYIVCFIYCGSSFVGGRVSLPNRNFKKLCYLVEIEDILQGHHMYLYISDLSSVNYFFFPLNSL